MLLFNTLEIGPSTDLQTFLIPMYPPANSYPSSQKCLEEATGLESLQVKYFFLVQNHPPLPYMLRRQYSLIFLQIASHLLNLLTLPYPNTTISLKSLCCHSLLLCSRQFLQNKLLLAVDHL
jgi:hypothetical protein